EPRRRRPSGWPPTLRAGSRSACDRRRPPALRDTRKSLLVACHGEIASDEAIIDYMSREFRRPSTSPALRGSAAPSIRFDSRSEEKFYVAFAARDLELDLNGIVGAQEQRDIGRGADRFHHVREVVEGEQGAHRLLRLNLLEQVLRDHMRDVVRVALRHDL